MRKPSQDDRVIEEPLDVCPYGRNICNIPNRDRCKVRLALQQSPDMSLHRRIFERSRGCQYRGGDLTIAQYHNRSMVPPVRYQP
jgi:hypothetical protein